jgi:protein-S-isoprenylcysteine O-methyltransferase Ste14
MGGFAKGPVLMGFLLSGVFTSSGVVDGLLPGAAGTRASWQAMVFALVWVAFSLPITCHLLTHPALLRRRLRGGPLAEREPRQRIIISLFMLCMLALFAILAHDYDSGGSHVPVYGVLFGDLLVAGGLVLIWLVFRANPFAAATVTVEAAQTVISSGPYALVRHPMYSGVLLLFLGIPLALGSWWGLVIFPPFLVLIIWRLEDEERYLSNYLPGYRDYCARVTHRLIPSIW